MPLRVVEEPRGDRFHREALLFHTGLKGKAAVAVLANQHAGGRFRYSHLSFRELSAQTERMGFFPPDAAKPPAIGIVVGHRAPNGAFHRTSGMDARDLQVGRRPVRYYGLIVRTGFVFLPSCLL
jgi:hypothetical protein